jgi:hypothetical protein
MKRNLILCSAIALIAAGCGERAASADSPDQVPTAATAPHTDSILAMDTMIALYQARLPQVTSFGDDAARSIDELVDRFVNAVRDSSTAALADITLSEAEFAYLYFPTSIYARSPYAQPPAVNWLLMEQNSLKGRQRLLREYGGRPLVVHGYDCVKEPVKEGHNRIHEHCTLRLDVAGDRLRNVRLFGSIMERAGRFKLMSLANRL